MPTPLADFVPREQKLCGCGCGEPLEPALDGGRHTIGGLEVNDDCYFEQFSAEIDRHPIGRPLRRF